MHPRAVILNTTMSKNVRVNFLLAMRTSLKLGQERPSLFFCYCSSLLVFVSAYKQKKAD